MVVDARTSAELQMKAAPCSVTMNAWGQSPAGRECWCWQSVATAGPLTEVNTIDTVPSLIFRCGGTISITTPPHSSPEQQLPAATWCYFHIMVSCQHFRFSVPQGRPQWGGRGGTGHPWDFNISETGDTIHQIRWHTWAWVKTQSLKSDLIQTNYFPILLATLNVFVNIQFSALFDL